MIGALFIYKHNNHTTMKKYLFAIVLPLLFVGCAGQEVPLEGDVVVDDVEVSETPTLADKIEDFSNYTLVTDADVKSFVPACDEYSEAFAQKVADGEVKVLNLYPSDNYGLAVYLTPNYDGWTEADFAKVNSCGELGSVTVRKVVADSLLWSYPNCTAGAIPTSDQVGYQEFVECTAVEGELDQYLGS